MPNHNPADKAGERKLAPHVQAALGVPQAPPGGRPPAPHVQAAVGNARPNNNTPPPRWNPARPVQPAVQDKGAGATPPGPGTPPPRWQEAATPQTPGVPPQVNAALKHHAPHVRTAVMRTMAPQQPRPTPGPAVAAGYVVYEEKKLGVAPPPASKKPVYTLHFDQKGKNCTIRNLATGQVKNAGPIKTSAPSGYGRSSSWFRSTAWQAITKAGSSPSPSPTPS